MGRNNMMRVILGAVSLVLRILGKIPNALPLLSRNSPMSEVASKEEASNKEYENTEGTTHDLHELVKGDVGVR